MNSVCKGCNNQAPDKKSCFLWSQPFPEMVGVCTVAQQVGHRAKDYIKNGNCVGGFSPQMFESVKVIYLEATGQKIDTKLCSADLLKAIDAFMRYSRDEYTEKIEKYKSYLPVKPERS